MRDCLICILSFLIGVLLWGYVIIFTHSSQYTINLGKLSDWVTSLATVGLLLCAIIGFGSWKKQKKPEATIDLLKTLENLQVKMNKEYSFILTKLENYATAKSSCNQMKDEYIQSLNENLAEIEWNVKCYQIYHPDKEKIIEKIHQKLLDIYCNYNEYEYFDKHFQKKLKKYTRFNEEKSYVPEEIKFEYATELFQRISWRYIRVMVKEITGKPLTLGVSAQHLKSKYRQN
ncbi:hypothetical protein [Haemophilus haemolyticus]|uniref:hypothetical protein n=1 Tax=Haemophilus haemolyticus TaxID=726 RepID=UPI000E584E37|nr:hypothetical protein [Haemophilus haemolyticus]